MTKYKVVRSYSEYNGEEELEKALNDGWELVWGSHFVPYIPRNGYIEYILKKEVEEEE